MADIVPASRRPVSFQRGTHVGHSSGDIPSASWTLVNVADYGTIDTTGTTSSQAAWDAARAATGSLANVVFKLPAGRIRLSSVSLPYSRQAVRGSGMFQTTIIPTGGVGVTLGNDPGWGSVNWNPQGTVTSGFSRGSTQITIARTPNNGVFAANRLVWLRVPDDYALPSVSWLYQSHTRRFVVFVTKVEGPSDTPTLTLDIPIPFDYDGSNGPVTAEQPQSGPKLDQGVEDLTLEGPASASMKRGIDMMGAHNMWVKNVQILRAANYGIAAAQVSRLHVKGCFVSSGSSAAGSNQAGFLINTCIGALIENNIGVRTAPIVEVNFGTVASVFSYNLFIEGRNNLNIDANHGPHNSHNLWENNIAQNLMYDGYFGTASDEIKNRNWFLGINPGSDESLFRYVNGLPTTGVASFGYNEKRGTRNSVVVNNVFGVPGYTPTNVQGQIDTGGMPYMGNGFSNGVSSLMGTDGATPWYWWDVVAGKPKYITATVVSRSNQNSSGAWCNAVVTVPSGVGVFMEYVRTHSLESLCAVDVAGAPRISSVVGDTITLINGSPSGGTGFPDTGGTCVLSGGHAGFWERDLDCAATAICRGNRFRDGTLIRDDFASGETAQASYMDSSRPGWLPTEFSWPAFDPTNIGTLSLERIPAGKNYLTYLATGSFSEGQPGGGDPPPAEVNNHKVRSARARRFGVVVTE